MTREELQPGRYYRMGLGCNTTLFQFKDLGAYNFEIYIYKGIKKPVEFNFLNEDFKLG